MLKDEFTGNPKWRQNVSDNFKKNYFDIKIYDQSTKVQKLKKINQTNRIIAFYLARLQSSKESI